jgi:hypothetical protein
MGNVGKTNTSSMFGKRASMTKSQLEDKNSAIQEEIIDHDDQNDKAPPIVMQQPNQ